MTPSPKRDERRESREPTDGGSNREPDRRSQEPEPTGLLANAALRMALLIVGFVLFLFALGQAVGLGLLGMFIDAVTSQTGRWLIVAFFGLVLIALAQRGFRGTLFDG